MHILIVTDGVYPYSMGGSHRLIHEAANALQAKGHRVTCVIPNLSKNTPIYHEGAEGAEAAAFRTVRFPVTGDGLFSKLKSYFRGYRKAVEGILAAEPVDAINVHYLPALFAVRRLCRTRKVSYTFHGPWAGEYRTVLSGRLNGKPAAIRTPLLLLEPVLYFFTSRIEGHLLRRCHRFMVLSQYMKDILCGTYRIDPAKVAIIPSGINLKEFYPEEDAAFRRTLNPGKSRVFLTVRRLEKRMGLDILIEACALLRRETDDFILLIGGKGPQFEYLQGLIKARGLEENVRMLGFIPEGQLRKFLSLADLFILPSRELEGFGLVVLESMACGTPVLVSPVGGPPEVVRAFDEALVLPSLDPGDIAARLAHLVSSGKLDESSSRCLAFVRQGYSWERFADSSLEWLYKA
jgi:glycosyltransferase involved in cell wall biosynthesis